MSTLATLVVKLTGDTSDFEQSMEGAVSSMGNISENLRRTGTAMSAGITLPLAAAGTAAVTFANDFNSGLANVASLGEEAAGQISQWRPMVQDLAITVGKSTTDMTDGLYQVVSAFGATDDSMGILEINAKAAAGGLSTTAEAINLTSAVTKAYGDTSSGAVQQVADLALATVQMGQTTFPELAASMGRVTPLASSLGLSMDQMFAVFATGTGVTGSAAEVSTQLRGILQSMTAPTASMTEMMQKYGYESGEAMLQSWGLANTLNTIVAEAEATEQPLQNFIGSIEGQTLAMALAGPQADTFIEKNIAMTQAAGTAEEAFLAQTEGINAVGFGFEQAKVQMQVWGQQIGQALLPAIGRLMEAGQPIIDWITGMIQRFSDMEPKTQMIVIGIAAFAAALGPVLIALGMIVPALGAVGTAIGVLLGPVGLVIAAVAALAVAFATNFGGIRDLATDLWESIKKAFEGIQKLFRGDVQGGLESLREAFQRAFDAIVRTVGNLWQSIQPALQRVYETISNFFRNTDWAAMGQDLANKVLDGLRQFAAMVGPVLANWATAFWNWVRSVDWAGLAKSIIDFIINGLKAFVTFVGSVLSTWDKAFWDWVRSVDWKEVGYTVVKAILEGLKWLVTELPPILAGWVQKFWDWVKSVDWGGIAQSIIDGIVRGLSNAGAALFDAMKNIAQGAIDAAKEVLGIESPSRAFMEIGALTMTGLAVGIERNARAPVGAVENVAQQVGVSGAEAFANAVTAVVDTVEPAINALLAMLDFDMSNPHQYYDKIYNFADIVMVLTNEFASAASHLKSVSAGWALKEAQEMADAAGAVVELVVDAIEALDALRGFEVPAVEPTIQRLVEVVQHLVAGMSEAASTLSAEALQHAQIFAETAGDLLDLVGPGVDAIAALSDYVSGSELGDKVAMFANDLTMVAESLANAFERFLAPVNASLTYAGSAAEAVGNLVDLITPALEAIAGLGSYVTANAFGDTVAMFARDLTVIAESMAAAFDQFLAPVREALENAGEASDAVAGLVDLVLPALEAIAGLGSYVTANNFGGTVAMFARDLTVVAESIAMAFEQFLRPIAEAVERAGSMADSVKQLLELLQVSIETLAAIAEAPRPNTRQALNYFINQSTMIMQALTSAAATLNGGVVESARQFAQNMADAVEATLEALDQIDRLLNADAPGSLQGILDAMTTAMNNTLIDGWQIAVLITTRGATDMAAAARTAALMVVAEFTNIDWVGIGWNIARGIATGIRQGSWMIQQAARQAAQSALHAAEQELGIASPSRVAEEQIGRPFVEGIAEGLKDLGSLREVMATLDQALLRPAQQPQLAPAGVPQEFVIHIHGKVEDETIVVRRQNGVMTAARARGVR